MNSTPLFNTLKLTPEDLLLSRKFHLIPVSFQQNIDKLLEKYINNEEYEKCKIVQDYKIYLTNTQ